ncbi:MAG: hypothetical protein MMC23_000252 [Stictis urceolatum]|nr:hypothetical protein [Stictis urceolata]
MAQSTTANAATNAIPLSQHLEAIKPCGADTPGLLTKVVTFNGQGEKEAFRQPNNPGPLRPQIPAFLRDNVTYSNFLHDKYVKKHRVLMALFQTLAVAGGRAIRTQADYKFWAAALVKTDETIPAKPKDEHVYMLLIYDCDPVPATVLTPANWDAAKLVEYVRSERKNLNVFRSTDTALAAGGQYGNNCLNWFNRLAQIGEKDLCSTFNPDEYGFVEVQC